MQISIQQSKQVKGLAILLMLFLHLFNNPQFAAFCTPLFYIGDIPLASIVARSCAPVGYFLIVSGYGLACSYDQGALSINKLCSKIFGLYRAYWLVLFLFVTIGAFINPIKYPGSYAEMLLNIVGWKTSYNGEMWFLFPYALLSLTSVCIFKLMDKIGNLGFFVLSAILYFVSCFIISRYIVPNKLYDDFYIPLLTYFDLLWSFVIGALLFRVPRINYSMFLTRNQRLLVCLLLVLFCTHFVTPFQGLNPIYQVLITCLFLHLRFNTLFSRLFIALGEQSMFMWMTHTFFAIYLFRDFIYGFKYPLLIYVVLIIISFFTAKILTFVAKRFNIL